MRETEREHGATEIRGAGNRATTMLVQRFMARADSGRADQPAQPRLLETALNLDAAILGLVGGVPSTRRLTSRMFPEMHLEGVVRADFEKLSKRRYDIATSDEYLQRVRARFGTLQHYLDWAPESDAILERPLGPKGVLLKTQVELTGEEQKVFFRWVSWEYRRRGFDSDAIAALIWSRMNPKVAAAVNAAGKQAGAKITPEGFNPRPMKDSDGRNLLGTLSEHAVGNAIDIAPARNPFVNKQTWKAIEAAVGIRVDRSLSRWTNQPKGFVDDMIALDRAWSHRVDAERQAVLRRADRYAGTLVDTDAFHGPPGSARRLRLGPTPILGIGAERPRVLRNDVVALTAVKRLLGSESREAKELANLPGFHFLALERGLILALRDQGFVWGATFKHGADLHHFEMRDPPLAPTRR